MITEENIIVSMTSWNKRITNVPDVLESIIKQTIQPTKILINLCIQDFPNMEEDLPADLLKIVEENDNIEIYWFIENYKAWKKHLYALDIATDKDIIISVDDDHIYPEDFIEKGIKRFIFNYQNANELRLALYKDITVAKSYTISRYAFGRYDFDFGEDSFKYEGKNIYLTPTEKAYIASWLLGGHKDNAKRGILCYARKRLGSGFLKDIDRFGRLKEDKDE
jgi:hypothetical protein